MFDDQVQWFAHDNSQFDFELPHSQGPPTDSLHSQSQSNPACYPQEIIDPSLGLFDIFQPIDYSQSQQQNFPLDKQACGPAVGLISPKSHSFSGAQTKAAVTPTAGLGPNSSHLIQQGIMGKESLSLMGFAGCLPQSGGDNFEYPDGPGYKKNNENIVQQGIKSYPFNPAFQTNVDSYMGTTSPAASLHSSRLEQMSILGADITNFLDSVFKEPGSTPIDSARDSPFPSMKLANLNAGENVGFNPPPTRDPRVNATLHNRPERDSHTGVLRPLRNGKQQALDDVSASLKNSQQDIRPISKTPPACFHAGAADVLDLPRIARNPPMTFSARSGPALAHNKRKLLEDEADHRFTSCRTLKSTRRVIVNGKNAHGKPTYCPLITVSIPSLPLIPEMSFAKTQPKKSNNRNKPGPNLAKKPKIDKHL